MTANNPVTGSNSTMGRNAHNLNFECKDMRSDINHNSKVQENFSGIFKWKGHEHLLMAFLVIFRLGFTAGVLSETHALLQFFFRIGQAVLF